MASAPDVDKRVTMIWEQGGDPLSLTLLRAKDKVPGSELKDRVRFEYGMQTTKHNHYTDDQFFRHDPAKGILTNVYGQRLIRVSEDFVVALLGSLEEEVGEAAGEIMYKCGYEWGMEDMKSFSGRTQAEFEVQMSKMGMGFLMESWWWPLTIEGWGTWRYDFRNAKQGLIFVELYESAVAQSVGDIGKVVCYFYAGLFSAFFSVLARRKLSCIEIQCYATGEDFCKFLVSTDKRVNAAAFWRNEGATAKDIVRKVSDIA